MTQAHGECKRNFIGRNSWSGGYVVSTVGQDKAIIRECIRIQEQVHEMLEQKELWQSVATINAFGRATLRGNPLPRPDRTLIPGA